VHVFVVVVFVVVVVVVVVVVIHTCWYCCLWETPFPSLAVVAPPVALLPSNKLCNSQTNKQW